VNQVVLLVQLNVGIWKRGKIATAWAQFGATESPSMYIRMRATVTLLACGGGLGSISIVVLLVVNWCSGIWKKVRLRLIWCD
jgi:hypothetical protein